MLKFEFQVDDEGRVVSQRIMKTVPGDATPSEMLLALGALESVKMALICGRWAILDSEGKNPMGYRPLKTEDYLRESPESEESSQ